MVMRRGNERYKKLEKEEASEKSHREAQFLIYKTMKQVDQMMVIKKKSSSKPTNNNNNNVSSSSWLKLRICKLKVRIGSKFLRLRKTLLCNMSKTKVGVSTHLMRQLKRFKTLFVGRRRAAIPGLPQPLFTI